VRYAKGAGGGGRMKRRACWTLEAANAVTKPHSGALGGRRWLDTSIAVAEGLHVLDERG
jgi:hypothetical protein